MGGKTAIALGLVTGLVAGGLIVGALITLTPPPPNPVVARTPEPSLPAVPSASPVAPSPSTVAPSPSADPSPRASVEPAPSASSVTEARRWASPSTRPGPPG
jgi:hypothetical protein